MIGFIIFMFIFTVAVGLMLYGVCKDDFKKKDRDDAINSTIFAIGVALLCELMIGTIAYRIATS